MKPSFHCAGRDTPGHKTQRGIAALEAALVLPVLVLIAIAAVDVYRYLRVASITDRVAFSVAHAVSQTALSYPDGVCPSSNADPLAAEYCALPTQARELFHPLDPNESDAAIAISAFRASGSEGAYFWEPCPHPWPRPGAAGLPGAPPAPGPQVSAPTAPTDRLVLAEATYRYSPVLLGGTAWQALMDESHVYRWAYTRARSGTLCPAS